MRVAGGLGLSNALNNRASARFPGVSRLLLSYLSASPLLLSRSFAAAQQLHQPTCPKGPAVCPATYAGLRFFQSAAHDSSHSNYTYRISASYSAKGHRLNPERNLFNHNPFVRIKPTTAELKNGKKDKRSRPASGQDAFFVSQVGGSNSVTFGVADGVGGWTDSGVDPADFAHGLCDYMAAVARGFPQGSKTDKLHPRDLLQIGYNSVQQDKSIPAGGSTAVVALAEADGHLEVANLGDSGFIHIGLNAVRYFSPPQTHAFNTPYQLSKIPPRMLAQMAMFGGALADMPKDAAVTSHRVRHGDVLVFATDGVWDNLSPQDALAIISRYMLEYKGWVENEGGLEVSSKLNALTGGGDRGVGEGDTLQARLALAITREAKEASENEKRDGPFAREVQRYYPEEKWHGGKVDDICVVVAVVTEDAPVRAAL